MQLKKILDLGLKNKILKSIVVLVLLELMTSCSSIPNSKHSIPEELVSVYLNDFKTASVDIVFERGHNSHRIYAFHKQYSPELHIFHDKQIYKSLKIDEVQFKDLLAKSIETAGVFYRKPAMRELNRCRTPFIIKIKNSKEAFAVEGCRSSDEGMIFGKLIAEIEHLAFANSIH